MEECKEVYSQVLGVLLALGDKYMQKIPKKHPKKRVKKGQKWPKIDKKLTKFFTFVI